MKLKFIIYIFLFFSFHIVNAQNFDAIINKASKMIDASNYRDAFDYLSKIDSNNNSIELTLIKIDILLNYNLHFVGDKFGLTNLFANQDIYSARSSKIPFTIYTYNIETILDSLINKNPQNWSLYNALGEYYFEILKSIENTSYYTFDELEQKTKFNFEIAFNNNNITYKTLFGLGYLELIQNKYEEAIDLFNMSLNLNTNPECLYFLAYSLMLNDRYNEAIEKAKMSIYIYKDNLNLSRVHLLLSELYDKTNQIDYAIENANTAALMNPNNYSILSNQLEINLKYSNDENANLVAQKIFFLQPQFESTLTETYNIYKKYRKEDSFALFLSEMLKFYKNNYEIIGNIHNHLAVYNIHIGEYKRAIKNLEEASKSYSIVWGESDNKVLEINSKINMIKSSLNK